MIFNAYDVVVVPFPFTDTSSNKRRPALVLSDHEVFGKTISHSVLAMITTASGSTWPLDVSIKDLDSAGLTTASKIRMKLFTLDDRLILRSIGKLADADKRNVQKALKQLLSS